MRLSGKRILITGGGTGIGKATALLFAAEGAKVLISARRPEPLLETAAQSQSIHAFPADLTTPDGPERIMAEAVRVLGGLDILVNNSALFEAMPLEQTGAEVLDSLLDVNVKGLYRMTQAALPELRKGVHPNILNIGSIVGLIGLPWCTAYSATKGAVHQITRSLASEVAPQGIRVNCVSPGLVHTELTEHMVLDPEFQKANLPLYPLGRFGVPGDIASACLFLVSDEASWCTGVILPVDGGFTNL